MGPLEHVHFRTGALYYEMNNRSARVLKLHSAHVLYRHARKIHERVNRVVKFHTCQTQYQTGSQ